MEIRRLRYFAMAAVEGSFHRAAARLNIAQPALSRQIRELEEELDVSLFIRSAQGVKLSPAGEVLLTEVKQLLPQIELARTKAKRAAIGQFGMVRVGLSIPVAELRFAVAAFADAKRSLPDVDFRLNLINSDNQAEAMSKGEIDVGVLYRREPYPSGMVFRDLRTERYMLMVNSNHPLTKRTRIRLADLRNEDMLFVSPAVRPATYTEIMGACLRGGLTPKVALELDNEAIMVNLVAEGIAICFANPAIAERRPIHGTTFLPVEDLDVALHLAAMWHKDRETPAILNFVELLVQHMNHAANSVPVNWRLGDEGTARVTKRMQETRAAGTGR